MRVEKYQYLQKQNTIRGVSGLILHYYFPMFIESFLSFSRRFIAFIFNFVNYYKFTTNKYCNKCYMKCWYNIFSNLLCWRSEIISRLNGYLIKKSQQIIIYCNITRILFSIYYFILNAQVRVISRNNLYFLKKMNSFIFIFKKKYLNRVLN